MKAVIKIIFFIVLSNSVFSQNLPEGRTGLSTVDIDSIVYANMDINNVDFLEISYNFHSKKKNAVISDSIAFLINLKSLFLNTSQFVYLSDSIKKLKKLNEVSLVGNFINTNEISLVSSKDSLQYFRLWNYGNGLLFLHNISIYKSLKRLQFIEYAKRINSKRIFTFFGELNNLKLESFEFYLPNVNRKTKLNLNSELLKKKIKYRIKI